MQAPESNTCSNADNENTTNEQICVYEYLGASSFDTELLEKVYRLLCGTKLVWTLYIREKLFKNGTSCAFEHWL